MTSLLSPTTGRAPSEPDDASAARRPLVAVAVGGGLVAAVVPLVVLMALGVIGWFLTDGGAHGAPRDGLRIGALAWLLGHGSGVSIGGTVVTAVPLGLTLLSAFAVWRTGHRVGEVAAAHGPDVVSLDDGARDWTVPLAVGLFTLGYVVAAVLTLNLAATADTAPRSGPVVLWSLLLCMAVGGTAIAVASGRAAIVLARVPMSVRATVALARQLLLTWLAVSSAWFVLALVVDFGTAANVMSQLGPSIGEGIVLVLVMLLVLPNAAGFSSSYLLGPGFTVGTGTLVTPQAAALGALPMFPLLAALPDDGASPGWAAWLVAVPVFTALVVTARAQRSRPTLRYDEGALRGCVAGVLVGAANAVVAAASGGAVGPGRMHDVGAVVGDVLLHGVAAFGVGGLVGGVAITWWQRRHSLEPETVSKAEAGDS